MEEEEITKESLPTTEREEEELSENVKEEIPPEQRIPIEIFRRESIDGKLDTKIATFLSINAIKSMNIGIPPCCTVKDILFIVEDVHSDSKYFTEDSFITYFGECLKVIQTEFMFIEEEEDSESFELTKDFIQERLSDLQQIEDSNFCFTFTSFCVQAADISDLSLLVDYESLTTISLKNNIISDFSPLEKMPRLKNLDLTENKIKSIRSVAFPVLEKLNLSKNKITFIESYDMPKLKDLNFSENKIFFIAPFAFSKCPSLETLDLSMNNLQDIREGAFDGLGNLKKLKLNANSIISISNACSKDLKNLIEFDLSENPLQTIDGIEFINGLKNFDLHKTSLEKLESLSPLKALNQLNRLSIFDTSIEDIEDSRLEIIHLVPSLEEIDEQVVTINERQDSQALFEQRAEEERIRLAEEAAAKAAALAAEEEEKMEQRMAETEGGEASETIYNEENDSAHTV